MLVRDGLYSSFGIGNALSHPETHEFNTEGVEVVCWLTKHISNSASRSGGHRDLSGSLHMVLREKACQRDVREPSRENIVRVWEDPTTDDAIAVIERALKATKPETVQSCWGKVSRCCA